MKHVRICSECGAAFGGSAVKENLRFCETTGTSMCADCYDDVECDCCEDKFNRDGIVFCKHHNARFCINCFKNMARELGLKEISEKIDSEKIDSLPFDEREKLFTLLLAAQS